MIRKTLALTATLLIVLSALIFSASQMVFADSSLVNDVSWPNCGEKLTNLTQTGIIGVNGGLDFSKNPCLASQSQLFHNSYALYLNTGYPGISYGLKFANYPKHCRLTDNLCLAYNFGYNAASYAINYAKEQNVHSFVWWLDVETENSWTTNFRQNRQALVGMIKAIEKQTFRPTVGFYSFPGQWQLLTNSWHNYLPSWVATASTSKNVAKRFCSESFNRGPVWLTQYTTNLDYSYSCLPKIINDFKLKII